MALTTETKIAYQKANLAIQEFAVEFMKNEPKPTPEEMELLSEELRDFGRDVGNLYFENDSRVLLDIFDMREAEEEQGDDDPEEGGSLSPAGYVG